MGFCLFNNVAVGAAHALAVHGLERVAIVDFDVHHGNGTEEIFSDDPRVLMVSTFQYPLYPYSGVDNPAPNMVNVPLAAGSRQRRVPRRRCASTGCRRSSGTGREHPVRLGRLRRAPRGSARGLKLADADYAWVTRELIGGRATRTRRAASSRRSKAATRCRRWAAAPPSTCAS